MKRTKRTQTGTPTKRTTAKDRVSPRIRASWWPAPLRHVGESLLKPTDDYAAVAEVTSEAINGYVGNRLLYTALVPYNQVDSALKAHGSIGHGVESYGPHPCIGSEGGFDSSFWIDGPNGARYETLVEAWQNNNRYVLLPDAGFLMCYGLVPRLLQDGSMAWDDPSLPVYDVVRAVPELLYTVDGGHSPARVEVRRDYLEDYLSLKGCAAVATLFDERWSANDPEIAKLLGGGPGITLKQPGRTLWLKRIHWKHFNQISQVWAARLLLLDPKTRPISDRRSDR